MPKVERNLAMCRLYLTGVSMGKVAAEFGISRARARQVLYGYGALRLRVPPEPFFGAKLRKHFPGLTIQQATAEAGHAKA